MSGVKVRFECGREDRIGPTLGPFEFLQVTYGELRISPDGDTLAVITNGGDWFLTGYNDHRPYSDYVIFSE